MSFAQPAVTNSASSSSVLISVRKPTEEERRHARPSAPGGLDTYVTGTEPLPGSSLEKRDSTDGQQWANRSQRATPKASANRPGGREQLNLEAAHIINICRLSRKNNPAVFLQFNGTNQNTNLPYIRKRNFLFMFCCLLCFPSVFLQGQGEGLDKIQTPAALLPAAGRQSAF